MIEHERDTVGGGQLLERLLHQFMSIRSLQIFLQIFRSLELDLLFFVLAATVEQLREEAPSRPVTGEMIQTHIGGDSFQPAAHRRTLAQLRKSLIRLKKDLLRNILC